MHSWNNATTQKNKKTQVGHHLAFAGYPKIMYFTRYDIRKYNRYTPRSKWYWHYMSIVTNKPSATLWFAQQIARANKKENLEAPHYWAFGEEKPPMTGRFYSHRAPVMLEECPCHDVTMMTLTWGLLVVALLDCYTVLAWWLHDCRWGKRHGLQLAGITLLCLVGLNIDWDCPVPHCIIGSRDQWKFPSILNPTHSSFAQP